MTKRLIFAVLVVLGVFMVFAVTGEFSNAYSAAAEGDKTRGEFLFYNPGLGTLPISCGSCHPGGRGLEAAHGKKGFKILGVKTDKLESVINFWVVNILRGEKLDHNSQTMKDIKAYIKSLFGLPKRDLPKSIPINEC
ncbi:MAG: hypothetical protein QMD07_02145 [Thermodesulfovibrionales bacterium]|nr:hypothetical protein [Thermodesulfovibrionales bacterium]